MKTKTLGWIVGFLIMVVTEAFASEQGLFAVGSDLSEGWTEVSAEVDDASGEITGVNVMHDFYSISEIRRGTNLRIQGVDSSRKALILHGALDASSGGQMVLRFLHDGRKGEYRDYQLDLRREGNQWKIFLPGSGRPVRSLYMHKNTFFGITVGVDEIKATFAAAKRPLESLAPSFDLQSALV